ncbi:carboxypeptidase-like regulatory domain-containing protein [Rhodocytophaga aerolata]|uniref:Carboxypeptidase-like regulatory domain-containing protein n=1 Tax=Rhodocytophaga aerolata TaxID=455078 RepID=A0ABT8REZ4_9BACT|nr:carboxypeptidase-like regulatory domain-containing protein [Rhodocytophaga aerolata]MDO1449292.1 carboxypeptidase-like regulatory domain-containing protein [Rhodocytophaga aerolata]
MSVPYCFSQTSIKIAGKVIDQQSGQPLAYAHIGCEKCLTGTAANEEGIFEITVTNFPVKLLFSYVGY